MHVFFDFVYSSTVLDIRSFARYLYEYDISGFRFGQAPPTLATRKAKIANFNSFLSWWHHCLKTGKLLIGLDGLLLFDWCDRKCINNMELKRSLVYDSFADHARSIKLKALPPHKFWELMSRFKALVGPFQSGSETVSLQQLKLCRQHFDEQVKMDGQSWFDTVEDQEVEQIAEEQYKSSKR